MPDPDELSEEERFEWFVRTAEPRLRAAFVARYGFERGREATAEALAYAWRERARVLDMEFPIAYLFRVGQSRTRRRREPALPPPETVEPPPAPDPGLERALRRLSARQRTVVVLCWGEGWTFAEVAELLGISKGSVQRHAERGIAALRRALGVDETGGG
jgi:DNA-directed RNA polymerase specialized sigma24 family protein